MVDEHIVSSEACIERYRSGNFDPAAIPQKPVDFADGYLRGPEPPDEQARRRALWYYKTDKTFKDRLNPIVELAKTVFDSESILISFLDDERMQN
ncbi:hypothetical protein HDV00_004493 [Rhizophlyctis rosea]|nr:hypothetical protein HDV00_004493 [Rhizophlyctis rosea]